MSGLPWFRMYTEFATDPVVQCLSFDDQRHFVMLLCFKGSGLLDKQFPNKQARLDVIRKSLGLDGKAWEEMRERLKSMGLIDEELQPKNWEKRQFQSDTDPTRAARQKRWRDRNALRNARITDERRPPDTDTDTDTDKRGRATKRRSRTPPADFEMTSDLVNWIATEFPRVDASRELAKFMDHEFATPRSDWAKAFKNWIRRADETTGKFGGTNGNGTRKLSAVERAQVATGGKLF